jgi:hypothetical protein
LTLTDLRTYVRMNKNSYDLIAVLQTDAGIAGIVKATSDHSWRSLSSTASGATE